MYPCCVITFWRPAFREGSHFLRFITFLGGWRRDHFFCAKWSLKFEDSRDHFFARSNSSPEQYSQLARLSTFTGVLQFVQGVGDGMYIEVVGGWHQCLPPDYAASTCCFQGRRHSHLVQSLTNNKDVTIRTHNQSCNVDYVEWIQFQFCLNWSTSGAMAERCE